MELYILRIFYIILARHSNIDLQKIEKFIDENRSVVSINNDREMSEIRKIDLLSIINRIRLTK